MAAYNFASYVKPKEANLRGIEDLGSLYGITYDQSAIESILNKATDAEYAVKEKEMQRAENQFAINQFDTKQSTIEALRANRADQIATGASRGIQAASEAGAVLGLQRESVAGATDLAGQRIALGDEIGAAYAANASKALSESNMVKQALAGVSSGIYGSDMLGYTGELQYNSALDTNASQRYSADVQAAAQRAAAAAQAAATIKAANISAAAQKELAAAQNKGVDANALLNSAKNPSELYTLLNGNGITTSVADANKLFKEHQKQIAAAQKQSTGSIKPNPILSALNAASKVQDTYNKVQNAAGAVKTAGSIGSMLYGLTK